MIKLEVSKKTMERFWRKANVCEHGKYCRRCCWEWKGNRKFGTKYARFNVPGLGNKARAHRFIWIVLFNHKFIPPDNVQILHACDNPPCVNIWHLFAGSHESNMYDRRMKGRGSQVGTRYTIKTASQVRRLYVTKKYTIGDLARKFGSSESPVNFILRGMSWRMIDDGLQKKINSILAKAQTIHGRNYLKAP